ncbi:hypothetical protein Tco_1211302 [Tanacetum coccineum]
MKSTWHAPDGGSRSDALAGTRKSQSLAHDDASKKLPPILILLFYLEDENAEDVQMADHMRPMEELLRIPILGIKNAIIVPAVLANEFELKTKLLDFISNNSFFGLENDDPHSHIKRFYQITRTFKVNQVPHDVVKLILFSFSLKCATETWLENEPPLVPLRLGMLYYQNS